jgi:proline iminopeptidase
VNNAVFFDPAVYHVVLFDQRGAGKSEPSADARENTTQLLIQDIEKLREHVGVQKWHLVFGGSWGSTLSLAYAQAHPEMCASLVLRGVFLGTRAELDVMQGGSSTGGFSITGMVWPEEFARFLSYLPEDKRSDPLKSYHALIHGEDKAKALEAAQEWNRWELGASNLIQMDKAEIEAKLQDEHWVMSHAALETHYFVNECFLGPDELLDGCAKIKDIPSTFFHSRVSSHRLGRTYLE